MFTQKILSLLTALFMFFVLTATAHATLIDNLDGTVTDTDTNLMWLKNANAYGTMNWDTAIAWADTLVYAGYSDWRLPTTPGTATGYLNEGELISTTQS